MSKAEKKQNPVLLILFALLFSEEAFIHYSFCCIALHCIAFLGGRAAWRKATALAASTDRPHAQ
jgi:hypothetical protein